MKAGHLRNLAISPSFLMKRVHEDADDYITTINDLPDEMIGEIVGTLHKDDTCSRSLFAAVNKIWRRAAGDFHVPLGGNNNLWAVYAMEHQSSRAFLSLIKTSAQNYLCGELAHSGRLDDLQWAHGQGCPLYITHMHNPMEVRQWLDDHYERVRQNLDPCSLCNHHRLRRQ